MKTIFCQLNLCMFSISLMIMAMSYCKKDSSALTMELCVFCVKPLTLTWVISFQKVCLGDESTWYIWNTICLENNWLTDRLYVEAGQHISFHCMHQDLQVSTGIHNYIVINPSWDEFKLRKMKIYVHFQSFLNIEMAQVVGTLPHGRQGPIYPILSLSLFLMIL